MRSAKEQTEAWVENYFVSEVEAYGGIAVKNQRRRGWPDRTVYWWSGVSDLVELKRAKGGQFEPLQLRYHEKLRRMGHNVFVINTREQVDEYIRSRLSASRLGKVPLRQARPQDDSRVRPDAFKRASNNRLRD